jgi:acetyl-CoA carboxylase biotin carboxylase subunit
MIAKVICRAQTREEAIDKMDRALREFIIEGPKTTIPFHIWLMQNKDFRAGNYTTKFLDNINLEEVLS